MPESDHGGLVSDRSASAVIVSQGNLQTSKVRYRTSRRTLQDGVYGHPNER